LSLLGDSPLVARLAALPLATGLAADDMAALVRLGEVREVPAGCVLIRQGEVADGAYGLLAGELEICRSLPGGGELPLATLSAPEVVGEIGLVADVRRTANVRAAGPVTVFGVERRRYDAACRLQEPVARRLGDWIVRRIGALNTRLMQRIAATAPPGPWPLRAVPAVAEAMFDYRPFLLLLKPFQGLDAPTREGICRDMTPRMLAPGDTLFAGGEEAGGIAIVVRGALEMRPPDGRLTTLQILGPGSLCGLPAALDGARHVAACHAREHSLVLELSQAAFMAQAAASDAAGLALRAAVAASVADSALVLSNRLAQLIGLQRAQSLLARQA